MVQSSSPDVRGRFERWFETEVVDPMADFRNPRQEWRRLVSEFAGTFFLVLVAAGGGMMSQAFPDTISRTAAVVAPGLMVMGIILFMGKISGAHLNPAVTIAFSLRGDFPWRRVPGYIVVQLLGATLAAWVLQPIIGVSASFGSNYPADGYTSFQAFLMEALLTLGLVSVILGTASGAQNIGVIGAIGVGGYIALAGLWGSPISGTSMNPARTFGPDRSPEPWRRSSWPSCSADTAAAAAARRQPRVPSTPKWRAPTSPERSHLSREALCDRVVPLAHPAEGRAG